MNAQIKISKSKYNMLKALHEKQEAKSKEYCGNFANAQCVSKKGHEVSRQTFSHECYNILSVWEKKELETGEETYFVES